MLLETEEKEDLWYHGLITWWCGPVQMCNSASGRLKIDSDGGKWFMLWPTLGSKTVEERAREKTKWVYLTVIVYKLFDVQLNKWGSAVKNCMESLSWFIIKLATGTTKIQSGKILIWLDIRRQICGCRSWPLPVYVHLCYPPMFWLLVGQWASRRISVSSLKGFLRRSLGSLADVGDSYLAVSLDPRHTGGAVPLRCYCGACTA